MQNILRLTCINVFTYDASMINCNINCQWKLDMNNFLRNCYRNTPSINIFSTLHIDFQYVTHSELVPKCLHSTREILIKYRHLAPVSYLKLVTGL